MIRTFGNDDTRDLFDGETPKAFPSEIIPVARRKLMRIHFARSLGFLASPPGNRLEKLRGLADCWSIRVNAQWRIVFKWSGDGADDVAIMDYH